MGDTHSPVKGNFQDGTCKKRGKKCLATTLRGEIDYHLVVTLYKAICTCNRNHRHHVLARNFMIQIDKKFL